MRWYRRFFRRGLTERQLEAELGFHLEQQAADYVAAGMTPEEARRRARLEFGGLEQVKEECREVGAARFMETLLQDMRYGLRMLAKSPGFTAAVVVTLALGIGANTAIFSLANALLFKDLPVKDPSQLVILTWAARKQPESLRFSGSTSFPDPHSDRGFMNVFSYSIFNGIRSRTQLLTDLFVFAPLGRVNLNDRGSGHSGIAVTVSGNYFSALGIHAAAGRLLLESDDQANSPCTAVLSFRFWQSAFGGDPSIPGRTVTLNATPCTIVGVTPKDFQGLQYLASSARPT